MLSPCFKGVIVKTTHSVCKVVGFPHGGCFTYTALPLPFYYTSVQYFGRSLLSIFVFNNLIKLCFSEKSVITWYGFSLDHFCIWWVGHITVQIPKGLLWWPLSSPLPVTWSFEFHYAMAGNFKRILAEGLVEFLCISGGRRFEIPTVSVCSSCAMPQLGKTDCHQVVLWNNLRETEMKSKLQSLQQIAHKYKLLNLSLFSINRASRIKKSFCFVILVLDYLRKWDLILQFNEI